MMLSLRYGAMLNEKIRKAILEYYYEYWQKKPDAWASCEQLAEELGISNEQLGANLRYLHDKGLLKALKTLEPYERWLYKITDLGIDAVENPHKFNQSIPFINLFLGDVGTVMQAQEIRIENGFYNAFKLAEELNISVEILRAVEEIEQETRKRDPNWQRIKDLVQKVKAEEKVFNVLISVLIEVFKKWIS